MDTMTMGVIGEVISIAAIGVGVMFLRMKFSHAALFLIIVGLLGIGFFTYGLVALV